MSLLTWTNCVNLRIPDNIWSFHKENTDCDLLGYGTRQYCMRLPLFWRNLLSPLWRQIFYVDATGFFEIVVTMYDIIQYHKPEYHNLSTSPCMSQVSAAPSLVCYLPMTAWTATLRYPFTSPFSLTIATLWISGTGYIKLLRYTNALKQNHNTHCTVLYKVSSKRG